jgi:hypothetical protein
LKEVKPKKFSAVKTVYTNTYIVAVCLKDEGQYPALIFTYDPAFDSNRPRTIVVQKWFDEIDIEYDRVTYIASGKKYNYKNNAIVAHFKNIYQEELAGTQVIHDSGSSFKIDSKFLFADRANYLEILSSVTYRELFPTDNKINVIAKNQ